MHLKATSVVLLVCFVVLEAAVMRKTTKTGKRRSITGSRVELGSNQSFGESGAFASAAALGGPLSNARYGSSSQGNDGYAEAGAPPHGSIGIGDFAAGHNGLGFGETQGVGGASGGYDGNKGGYGNEPEPGMPYQFEYSVNEYGNNFGHSQSSDGNKVTGRYFVQLPDGRMQRVQFKADAYSGYTADVQYEGQAQYPSHSGGYGENNQGFGGSTSSGAYGAGNFQGGHGGVGPSSGGYAAQGNAAGPYAGRSPSESGFGLGNGIGGGSIGQLPLAFHGDDGFTRQPSRH